MRTSFNVPSYDFGIGSISLLRSLLAERRKFSKGNVVYFIDEYFKSGRLDSLLEKSPDDHITYIPTKDEPTTDLIDRLTGEIQEKYKETPHTIVGIGGGITLDTTKAVSNLLTNGGKAEDYQGWDLVKKPGVYKIGIPTLSGTGAESSRTCVLTNLKKNIKLGMNSQFSIMNHLILDPSLSKTVDKNQYFYTGMDSYIHCVESLRGTYRHSLADSFSDQSIKLCREIYLDDDMMSDTNREKLMVASYLGGASIANTYVGVVHPLSAGLSTVLHLHHCIANCIVMNVMEEFYPQECEEFKLFAKKQKVIIPSGVCKDLKDNDFRMLYESMIIHEKPLVNALGPDYRKVLTLEKVSSLYARM